MWIDLKNKQQTIQLVQITDAHLGSQQGEQLLGMDTDKSLSHVVNWVSKERRNIDLLLATGDLSNDGTESSYRRFRDITKSLARHTLWLPGNHDLLDTMQKSIDNGEEMNRCALVGNWQILMLNSAVEGEVGGNFTTQELDFLQKSLMSSAKSDQKGSRPHVLVCLHHHPVSIGCDWLDQQQVANANDFFNVIDQFDHVRGILWGHIHQQVDRQRNGVKLMASPSSCIQFAPNSQQFKLDRLNPGYRWLELHADGQIDTGISRVTGVNFNVDYENSTGY